VGRRRWLAGKSHENSEKLASRQYFTLGWRACGQTAGMCQLESLRRGGSQPGVQRLVGAGMGSKLLSAVRVTVREPWRLHGFAGGRKAA
jgi:hypothetical protein